MDLGDLYLWIDQFPFSRQKRNIARDFSDGVLCAELLSVLFPKLVELHNYPSAHSVGQKIYNWTTLNYKVLRKIGCPISENLMQNLAKSMPGQIEKLLFKIHKIVEKQSIPSTPEPEKDELTTLRESVQELQNKVQKLELQLELKERKIRQLEIKR